ncbi:ATP-dependent helicase [Schlesneria paludicola]|uniref:ATP-dependent helicase n=1 Tax=Schlesneria paludicola TaxID=360056 RepID=UPI00029A90FF|nr:ATP-dependent helicase [Schlesneria paludicola]
MSRTTAETSPSLDDLLSTLNPEQRSAALHGDSPLLIVAGAGTGKTTTLAHRVAAQIARGIDPKRVLLLTFTRRSAAEMLRRVDSILVRQQKVSQRTGNPTASASRDVCGGTFHAVATRLLRQHGKLIGLEPEFTVIDRSDAEDLLNVLRAELELAKADKRFPLKGTCLDVYSRVVSTQLPLEQVLKESFPWVADQADGLKKLFNAYSERKEQQQTLDYDDLLLFWHFMMTEPACGELVRRKFDRVMVDEYQDTNTLQAEIVKGLAPEGRGLTVVGDDAQSIYSFRAATVRNILDFPTLFPGTTVLPLEQNYRSTQPILDATNRVIALAAEGHRKTLWSKRTGGGKPYLVRCLDENEQTNYVIEQVLALRETGVELKQQAVLFRAAHHSLSLELELSRRNIPFHKYGGLKFVEAAHVKDLLAFLRFAENPRDSVSALRMLLLLPGIGPKKATQLVQAITAAEGDLASWSDFKPPAAAAVHWPLFIALLRLMSRRAAKPLGLMVEIHHVRTFYAPLLEQKYDDAFVRVRDLEQIEQMASRFDSRSQFLSDMTLDPPTSTQDFAGDPLLDEDYLTLSTIHSAKGLEWESVYVLHAADGNIPSDMATESVEEIEEERRLFYVALTRAKSHLHVLHPQRYYFHSPFKSDRHSYSQRTRFIPDELLTWFESKTIKTSGPAVEDHGKTAVASTADVRKRIGKMWS